MAPNMPIKIVGLRPGEKIHEILCPSDSSRHTLSFKNHFIIKPELLFFGRKKRFYKK